MGRSGLGDLANFAGGFRELAVSVRQVIDDLLAHFLRRGTLELEGNFVGRVQLDGHAAVLGHQIVVVQATHEMGDTGVSLGIAAGIDAFLDAVQDGVADVDARVHVVPEGAGSDGVGVDRGHVRGERGAVVVPHAVGVVSADGILVGAIVQVTVAGFGAVVVTEVVIQTDDERLDTFVRVEVVGVALGGELLVEEVLAAGSERQDHRSCQHAQDDISCYFHNALSFKD